MGLVPAGATATQDGSVPMRSLRPRGANAMSEIGVVVGMLAVQPFIITAGLNNLVSVNSCFAGVIVEAVT